MKSDNANVCIFVSALVNCQRLSALTCLHFKMPNRVTALMRLHLKIANQELGSPAVCTFASAIKRYTLFQMVCSVLLTVVHFKTFFGGGILIG